MRESDDGRRTVPPWGDAPAPFSVGDPVYSGSSRGTVVYADGNVISVVWNDTDTELDRDPSITYPADASYLRKGFPWE